MRGARQRRARRNVRPPRGRRDGGEIGFDNSVQQLLHGPEGNRLPLIAGTIHRNEDEVLWSGMVHGIGGAVSSLAHDLED